MADDRFIVNGAHQADRMRELLDVFIDKFVLCPSCKNPETDLVITGKGRNEDIHRDCKACGRQNGIEMKHKLVTFILKNPAKKEKGKKGKKGMTAEANVGGPLVFDKEENSGDDEAASPVAETSNGVPTSGTDIDAILGKTDDILDNPDEVLADKVKAVDLDDDDEEDANSPYALLGAWLEENRDAEDKAIVDKIKDVGVVGKHKVLLQIGQRLFTDEVAKEIEARVTLLQIVSGLCVDGGHGWLFLELRVV
jgi:translation initiation factor 5